MIDRRILAGLLFLLIIPACSPPELPPEDSVKSGLSAKEKDRIRSFWSSFRSANQARVGGEIERASALYEKALTFDPEHEDALYWLGSCRLDLGLRPEALDAFERLVATNPRSSRGQQQIGWLRIDPEGDLFDPALGLHHFQAAYEINRVDTGAILGRAEAYLLVGDDTRARESAEAVLVTDPASRRASLLRGFYAWRAGDRERAHADLIVALGGGRVEKADIGIPSEGDTAAGSAGKGATATGRVIGLLAAALEKVPPGVEADQALVESVYGGLAAALGPLVRPVPIRSR